MDAPSLTRTARIAKSNEGAADEEDFAYAPVPAVVATRERLPRTRLGDAHGILKVDSHPEADDGRPALATRREAQRRRQRNRRVLTGIALILAVFPPMWAVYLISWLVWRNRAPQKSVRQVRKAVKALEKNQTGVALRQLQDAHFLDPANTDALYWLGLLMSRQNRQEEAEEALSLVAERVPGLPEVEAALVDAYVAMDAPESAVYHAQRLLDAAPYAPGTLLKLADAYEAAGRPDLAADALRQAPIHKPRLTDDLLLIHYRLGQLYERQGETERALEHFKRVYARDITYRNVRTRVQALEAG